MTEKSFLKGVKITKIKDKDKKNAQRFCQIIFKELNIKKSFAYGFKDLKKYFGGPREIFLLAKKNGKIVACVGLKKFSERAALLKRLYVAKKFRGKGLSDRIFLKIKAFAKKKNYRKIVLDVPCYNLRAKKFYKRHCFIKFRPPVNEAWPETKYSKIFEFRKLKLS